jgi:ubiquinone/menaquinone biosynthesis C-methylase UbiE
MSITSSNFKSWEDAVQWLREQPDQRDLVRAAYYDDPLVEAAHRYWSSDEWSALRTYLPAKGGDVLDVGAGRGIASYALAKDGFKVTSLEPNGSGLVGANAIRELARATGLPISVTQEFSERLPFADGTFDVVYARAVLHHTTDLSAACREFFRVLKPGGRLVAIREHVISRPEDLSAFLEVHPLHKIYGGENAFMLHQYTEAIVSAGFRMASVLAPFDSPINFAPHSLVGLQSEIAARVGANAPGMKALANALLGWPPAWAIARKILNSVDNRPGRLYSFISNRP